MKKQYGFIRFDNIDEFETWLNKQNVKRKVNRLQVHNMYLPDYNTWNTTDKRVYGDNRELGRTKSLDDYGKNTWNYPDDNNHYIAQHFNVFPNGKITTGRDLDSTPIGIKGWNTNAICIEIYGNFDYKQDKMTDEQKRSVIAIYALLCKKFKLTPNADTIRPHCWFTASGEYLGDYISSKSAKSCPGTNFMDIGNTKSAFINKFYPLIKNYMKNESYEENEKPNNSSPKPTKKLVKNISKESLNIRSSADWYGEIIDTLNPGDSLTYVAGPLDAKGDPTKMYKCKNNVYITASSKYTKIIEI